MTEIPFVPVKPIRGGKPLDKLYRQLEADPAWVCQAKLNGKRCIWDGEVLWTRTGNRVPVPNIRGVLAALTGVSTVIDGELIKDVFWAYDLPDHTGPLYERWAMLERLIRPGSAHLKLCPSGVRWDDVALNGWEGVVFKRLSSKYEKAKVEGKTVSSWVKYRAEWW